MAEHNSLTSGRLFSNELGFSFPYNNRDLVPAIMKIIIWLTEKYDSDFRGLQINSRRV